MTGSPFQNHLDVESYVDTPIHDEAYARMMFVVEQRRRIGLLTGAPGTGKSMVLRLMARDLSRQLHRVVQLDLTGLTTSDFIWELAARLQLNPSETDRDSQLWRRLEDELSGNDLGQRPIAILLDNFADNHQVGVSLHRLFSIQEQLRGWLSIIIASRDTNAFVADQSLLEISSLHTHLKPLDLSSLSYYVAALAKRASGPRLRFEADAVSQLHAETGGIPRAVNHVCDFAGLLAADSHLERVNEEILKEACQQTVLAEAS